MSTSIQVNNPAFEADQEARPASSGSGSSNRVTKRVLVGGLGVVAVSAGLVAGVMTLGSGASKEAPAAAAIAPAPSGPTGAPTQAGPQLVAPVASSPEADYVDRLALSYASNGCSAPASREGFELELELDDEMAELMKMLERDAEFEARHFEASSSNARGAAMQQNSCQGIFDAIKDLDTTGWTTEEVVLKQVLEESVKFDLLEAKYPYNTYIPVHSMQGPISVYGRYLNPTLRTQRDFYNHASLVQSIANYADGCVRRMQQGLSLGYKAHSLTVEYQPAVIAEMLNVRFVQDLGLMKKAYSLLDSVPGARSAEPNLRQAGINFYWAYRGFSDYLQNTYIPALKANGPESFGIAGRVPADKRAIYDEYLVPYYTSTSMTADEVHNRGLAQVESIRARMEEIAARQGFSSVLAYRDALEADEANQYSSKEDMLEYNRLQGDILYPLLDSVFINVPEERFVVEAIPEGSATPDKGASYEINFRRVNLNAVFYQNSRRHTAPALMAHEGVPGHHMQLMIEESIRGLHPLRASLRFTSYTEGWGLYSEFVAENDMDFYKDDAAMFGRLQLEQMRAARLVVDTGMHSKGWSYDDCVNFMFDNFAAGMETAKGQCLRYLSYVGQALAYKSGEIVLKALRARAEAALGDNFDIRQWHDKVLQAGMPPVNVLETIMDGWLEEEKAKFA